MNVDWHRTVWQVVHNVSGERHCLPTYWAVTHIVSLHRLEYIA